eukprot:CAMPEP_0119421036 /NCGR_PEP_ID=MMETSP1335-20130426/24917_1 /TAXON_ID=259385 /ORGANISM="Chrysoculter rhomboideus, Strain RCC1486" /LENGTH=89 /DNA_ID=CAMNT_0007446421 /DNA_START=425 /DNA_END=694 /DNA_ORIENTATION=+
MNSSSGHAAHTSRSLVYAVSFTSDMSTPFTAVALTCTRWKPRACNDFTNVASPRRTSSTREEHKCAASRGLAAVDRQAMLRFSTHSGDA